MSEIVIGPGDLVRRASWLFWDPNKEILAKLKAEGSHTLRIEPGCHPVQISVEDLELKELDVPEGTRVQFSTPSIAVHQADCRSPVDAGKIKAGVGPLRFAGGGRIQKVVPIGPECTVYGPDAHSRFELILRQEPVPGVKIASGTRVRFLPTHGVSQPALRDLGGPRTNTDQEANLRDPLPPRKRKGPF
jgi:hypothetical protein